MSKGEPEIDQFLQVLKPNFESSQPMLELSSSGVDSTPTYLPEANVNPP